MSPDRESAPSDIELQRLRWQCRRGLLELDLTLEQFLKRHARALNREELSTLNALLDLGDNELWDVVSGRAACGVPRSDMLLRKLQESWT
jgi:antitoxin CptB